MRDKTIRWLRILGLSGLGLGLLIFAYGLRSVFNPVLAGFLLAYVLTPLVDWLVRIGMRRVVAILNIYMLCGVILLGAIIYGGPLIMREIGSLVDAFIGEEYTDLNGNGRHDDGRKKRESFFDGWRFFDDSEDEEPKPEPPPTPEPPPEPVEEDPFGVLGGEDGVPEDPLGVLPTGPVIPQAEEPQAHTSPAGDKARQAGSSHAASEPPPKPEPFVDRNNNGRYDAGYVERIRLWAKGVLDTWNAQRPDMAITVDTVAARLKTEFRNSFQEIRQIGETIYLAVRDNIFALFQWIGFFALVPIYTFFFLLHMHDMSRVIIANIPGRIRLRAVSILAQMDEAIACFFRGRLLICAIDAALTCILLLACGIRFWSVFGVLTGMLGIIPMVGPVIAFVPIVLLSLIDHGLFNLIVITIGFWGIQCVDGFALTPLILGAKVHIHPLTLIIAFMVGGKLFGAFGVLAAVPIVSILKILGREFVMPQLRALSQEGPAPPALPPETE